TSTTRSTFALPTTTTLPAMPLPRFDSTAAYVAMRRDPRRRTRHTTVTRVKRRELTRSLASAAQGAVHGRKPMAIETDVAARAGERRPHPDLHNDDLAPVASGQRRWGWFEIFNVWTNDVQSLAGYTLAATL